jgi:transcriptional regulator GlxA family with amidase domain
VVSKKTPTTLNVGFVLIPGMLITGTALPYEMWAAAADSIKGRRGSTHIKLHVIRASELSLGPLSLEADYDLQSCPQLDILYLPALWRNPRAIINQLGQLFYDTLVDRHENGTQVAAVGSGVSILAKSGLLDGRAATTHWHYFEQFEKDFPRVHLKRNFFITQSGSLYCAASINSLADVTVHLMERFIDRTVARHVERNFSHEIRRTYEEYRYLDGGRTPLDDEIVLEAQIWISQNLSAQVNIEDLARQLGVALRTLNRRFNIATGNSVRQYWQKERVAFAKELLGKTNLSISEICWRVGYGDVSYFSRLFQREISVTPLAYRKTVRAKLFRLAN